MRWAACFMFLVALSLSAMEEQPLRLSVLGPSAPAFDSVEVSFREPEGRQYFVEQSGNLDQWSLLPRFSLGGDDTVRWEFAVNSDRHFFRLLAYPLSEDLWVTDAANTDRVDYHLFQSQAVGRPVSFHVQLPLAYENEPERHFPVLYWLHGSGPGIQGIPWLSQYFGNAMDSGEIPPMILVYPNGLPDGMWCDSKNGLTPVETMLIHELIPFMDTHFRTIPERRGRILEGFSMGGYGAGRLGLKHAGMFQAFSMMGAGPLQLNFLEIDPNLLPLRERQRIFAKVYGDDMDYYEQQSPWRQAEASVDSLPPDLHIRIIVGLEDSMLDNNRALHGHFLELGIEHHYTELPGIGHNPVQTLLALGQANFDFYRTVLSSADPVID